MDVELAELRTRFDEEDLVVLDVREPAEYDGSAPAPCDPRHGHIPGSRNLPLSELLECRSLAEVRRLVGLQEGVEVVAYCHSGSRSAVAVRTLRGAGYDARNYVGSWHEWSRDDSLPVEG